MNGNNFKIAYRVLRNNKINTVFNLTGLTIGLACFLLLGLFVKQELSYDQFHSRKDRIYRIWLKEDYGDGKIFFNAVTPLRFESLMEDNFPEVEKTVQYIQQNYLVGGEDKWINENVSVISPDFFEVFDFELIRGNLISPLSGPDEIIVSQSTAVKYFGMADPVGKTLSIKIGEEIRDFVVSAVFKDIRKTSSVQFDLAISTVNNASLFSEGLLTGWWNVVAETYVLLNPGADIASVDEKMQDVILGQMASSGPNGADMQRDQYKLGFQPLTDIHLNPDIPLGIAPVNNPQYVYILGIIGLLVLIIAGINYTSLSVGQSFQRAKEVGMRKVLGAERITLVYQYLSESIIVAFIAMIIATLITILLIPSFNALTNAEIVFKFTWVHLAFGIMIGLLIGLLAGIYPALIISGINVMKILKGQPQKPAKFTTRKGLVVLQFVIAVFLISTTLIMRRQVNYLLEKDLGFEYHAVMATQLPVDPASFSLSKIISSGMENGKLLKQKLETYPKINKIAMGTHVFGTSGWAGVAYTDENNVFRRFKVLSVDPAYIDAFGIKMKMGRNFEENNSMDFRQSIILNEAAVKLFGLDNPINAKLPGNNFGDHRIIGVVEDFNFTSLHTKVEPLVITQDIIPILKGVSDYGFNDPVNPKLVFTYAGTNLIEATEILKKEWESVFPDEDWNFQFIDTKIKAQYQSEIRLNKLIGVATVLSILIAGMGLLGLTLLVVNSKVKEIGIRKVMGASTYSLFWLLAKKFVLQLIISILISIPLTLWLMNNWLENFAYRVEIGPWLFFISGIISVIIAFIVIGYYTLKASRINPIESLKID